MVENPTRPESINSNLDSLTSSQRALLAARQVDQLAPDAKQRQKAGVRAQNGSKGKAADLAAKPFEVSARMVELALAVERFGDQNLLKGVERGATSVRLAAEIATLQPQVLLLLQKLFALRFRAFGLDKDPDQSATDWLESMIEEASPSEDWLWEPDWNACPRCGGRRGAGCTLCFQMPTDPWLTPVKSKP
jgi:hypothetical protein